MIINESIESIRQSHLSVPTLAVQSTRGKDSTYQKGTKSCGRLHTYIENRVGNHKKIKKPLRPVGPRPAHFTSFASENGLSPRVGGVRVELRPSLKPEARRASIWRGEESVSRLAVVDGCVSSSLDEDVSSVETLWLNWSLFVVDVARLALLLLLFSDSSSIRSTAGALLGFLFLTEGPRTITGLAVIPRATHELLPLTASARASCAGVMAGTAGASAGVIVTVTGESSPGAFDPAPPLWMLTTAARDRWICCAGMALTIAS